MLHPSIFAFFPARRVVFGILLVALTCLTGLAAAPAKAKSGEKEAVPTLLSVADFGTYRRAFAEAEKKRWKKARVLAALAHNPLPGEVIQWLYYTQPQTKASFDEIATFLRAHPDWPRQRLLRQRAEEAMPRHLPDEAILAWFADYPPVTTHGHIRFGEARLRSGDHEGGKKYLIETWRQKNFSRHEDRNFLSRHRKLFSKEDHVKRIDRLLWEGRHWEAKRMLYRVDPDQRSLAIARISLMKKSWAVDKDVARVPKHLKAHPGLQYERLRWRRRKGKTESARKILENPPEDLGQAKHWWRERVIIVRRLFREGYYSEAYRLAKGHGQTAGEGYAEAEWLAGWIALRFLNDHQSAFVHFTNLYRVVRYPISRARGAYWAARAAEAMGARSTQGRWYRTASQYLTTYYGQLAAERLNGTRATPLPSPPKLTPEIVNSYEALPLAQVARLLQEIGATKHIRLFILQLAKQISTPEAYAWLSDFALSLERPDLAIAITKRAQRQNILLFTRGYPTLELPEEGPESALVLAVTRQESAFDKGAKSPANALGLMQLLPRTARAVSRTLRLRYSRKKLLSDPDYNIRLGGAYLDGLIKAFDGSYVLAISAYNAGPTRVRRWIRQMGTPHEAGVSTIDWVESIPIHETRNYVQRVLENLQIYRMRLNGGTFLPKTPENFVR